MALTADNYAALGLKQDADGYFTPIEGFGVYGDDQTPESLAAMSGEDLKGLVLHGSISAQNRANEANTALLAEQLNTTSGYGATARQEITDVFSQERARSTQSLAARGLGSTTADTAAQSGIAGREARAVTRLEESVAAQRLSILGGASYQQPDSAQLFNQMKQAGQAGVGSSPPSTPAPEEALLWGAGGTLANELIKGGIKKIFQPDTVPTPDTG